MRISARRTCRRRYLDDLLSQHEEFLPLGKVLDGGGKKVDKRGRWQPAENPKRRFVYLNTDPSSRPDILSSIYNIPRQANFFDGFICCEVLEHLETPQLAIRELFRVTSEGGYGIITMPFLSAVHGDPEDFQRWTQTKLVLELGSAGFTVLKVNAMGGLHSVISDAIASQVFSKLSLLYSKPAKIQTILSVLLDWYSSIAVRLDGGQSDAMGVKITTGWFVLVQKPLEAK